VDPIKIAAKDYWKFLYASVEPGNFVQAKNARCIALTAGCLFATPCWSADFRAGAVDGLFDLTASYGLGETVVQGAVNPDEFYVHKPMLAAGKFPLIRRSLGSKLIKMEFDPAVANGRTVRTVDVPGADRHRFSLTDEEVLELARYAVKIEKHYGRPMDIEWGKDGVDGRL